MARTLEEVRNDALVLTLEERANLAEDLFESIQTLEEKEIAEAWLDEAERRWRDIEAGNAKLIPGDEVLKELRATNARHRRSR